MKNLTVSPVSKNGSLFLGAMRVEAGAPVVAVRQPAHHLFVFDKSGSMYSTLPKLVEDLKKQVRQLKTGDALTVAWFSSSREFGFPIKAFRIVDDNSFIELDRLFDMHKRAMNLTCFSDVLGELQTVLDETAFLNSRNFLTFFSDGWANSPSVSTEHDKCRWIMSNLNGKFDLVLTVAYSDYADRDFLAELAALAGGECVSSAYLHQFTEVFSRFLKRSEFSVPRVRVALGELKPEFVFSVDHNPETGGVTCYEPDDENAVYFAPLIGNSHQYLYFLSRDNSSLNKAIVLDGKQIDLQSEIQRTGDVTDFFYDGLLTAAFASAVVLSQYGQQDEAIEVLGFLGDEHLVKTVGNAYTPTEKANAEDEIRHTIFNESKRWQGGVKFNCTPDADAFCLLDLLTLLQQDSSARFHPRHPAFEYKRIGRSGKQRAGFPMFVADAGASSPVSDLVWNSEFLNLSIRAKISGTVELPEHIRIDADGKLSSLGTTTLERPASLPEIFPTFQWRNYTLVKDGFLNVSKFPVSYSMETAEILHRKNLSNFDGNDLIEPSEFDVLELDKIPVINRRIAENTPTAKSLAEKVYADEVLSAEIKVLKAVRLELDPRGEIVSRSEWTLDEQRFLTALGFSKDGSYSPPVDLLEATDQYDAVSFKISVKGFSTLPKLSEVRDKMKNGKTLNAPGMAMCVALKSFNNRTEHFSLPEKLDWIDKTLRDLKTNQISNRTEIQKPKFALVLGHKSFADVKISEEPAEVVFAALGGEDLTAKISITKKQIKI